MPRTSEFVFMIVVCGIAVVWSYVFLFTGEHSTLSKIFLLTASSILCFVLGFSAGDFIRGKLNESAKRRQQRLRELIEESMKGQIQDENL